MIASFRLLQAHAGLPGAWVYVRSFFQELSSETMDDV